MDVDPFHLAGNLSRFVAGRRPADVTWVINQHALRGGLHRIVVDVEFAVVHDSDHRLFHAGHNSKRAAASICRATSAAATAGRNRAYNRSDSDRYRVGLAATLVIHPASEHYATTAVDDSALAVGRRVVAPGHSAACQRIDRTHAAATGGDHRSRTGAHPPPRLPDQSAAGGGRNLALLSPCGLVGLAPDSSGAGTLL